MSRRTFRAVEQRAFNQIVKSLHTICSYHTGTICSFFKREPPNLGKLQNLTKVRVNFRPTFFFTDV